jgi:site-specific DNA recombinase
MIKNNLKALLIARASDKKQVIEGDTLDNQIKDGEYFANKSNITIVKIFKFVESATSEERKFFHEVIAFCVDPRNNIDIVLFKDISRFTRGGAEMYLDLKRELTKHNIQLMDFSTGIIQNTKNTLERTGFNYFWSSYYPSEASEIAAAESAKAEVRTSLTRMIGQEIDYAQKGFLMRRPPLGLAMEKVETTFGKRSIPKPHHIEAEWIIKIAEMRTNDAYSDDDIVNTLNGMGFQTRKRAIRDKETKRVISYKNGDALDKKLLARIISKPIYAGVICEKWTYGKGIKTWGFDGLYDIEVFNKINKGKIKIIDNGTELELVKNTKEVIRQKNNPLYPFKSVILCPVCKTQLLASASRGKSGKKHPAYHCSRNHKRFSASKEELEKTVDAFVARLKFKKDFIKLFEESFLNVWNSLEKDSLDSSITIDTKINTLKIKQSSMLRALAEMESADVKEAMELEIEVIIAELKTLTKQRNNFEKTCFDIHTALQYATKLMEHPYEILKDTEDSIKKASIFKSFFKRLPDYTQLVNGTPELSGIFELSAKQNITEDQLVTPRGIEPLLSG